MPPPDDDMVFDSHRTHTNLPICTKLELSNSIGGVFRLLTEIVFLVNSQDDLVPRLIDELEVIANGLQVEVAVEHASVFCESINDDWMRETLDDVARKAAPDASAISELFKTLQEL